MNWLKYLVGLSAILVAGCAAFFSVTGLGVLFSGASVAVMIMASSLELAKLVAATYLKQTWEKTSGFNKWYLTIAVGALMLITSAGIFGYLSNAFQQQNLKLDQVERELAVYKTKIEQNDAQITQYSTQISEFNRNQGTIIEKGKVNNRLLRSIDNRDKQINQINKKISDLQEDNAKNNQKINDIKNQNIDLEREVGGFRFVAEAFGMELKSVVKFFIILIVFVFDPLAIALVIAFNALIGKKNMYGEYKEEKNYEIYEDSRKNSPKPEEKEEIVENILQSEEDKKVFTEVLENPPAPNEELVEAKKEYDEKVEEQPQTFENLEKLTDEAIENQDELQNLTWEQYMHPDFPWHKKNLWINNQKAVQYWLNNRGGSVKELVRIKNEEENTKTY